jgi:HAD superfamily hydrolase (TIGR01509 family)
MRFADLDGITVDAFGTLVRLRDPVGKLAELTGREPGAVRVAFETEMAYYMEHAVEGRDESSLAELHAQSAAVFSEALGGAEVSPRAYVSALEYEELEGVREALASLQKRGLTLAVVANWDSALPQHLDRLGLAHFFAAIVTSADACAAKPDPRIFNVALDRIGIDAQRALHIGDSEADERGAAAAGLHFAAAPVPRAVEAMT